MRANDEDLAKLSNAVSCAGSHFDIEHDRTRNLCLAIAAISKNVALQIFVQLLLTSVTPKKTTEAASPDSSAALNAISAAVTIAETGLARPALLPPFPRWTTTLARVTGIEHANQRPK